MDYVRQKDFILKFVNPVGIERKKAKEGYYLPKRAEYSESVCKFFFLKTLCISHGPVDNALKGQNAVQVFDRAPHQPENLRMMIEF